MNEFEKVSDEVNGEQSYDSFNEFAIEWVRGSNTATVTFPSSSRFKTKIEKLASEYPDEVKIRHENKDGSIVGTIPVKFVKIGAPRKVSEEQKEAAAERLRKMREKRENSLPDNRVST